MHTLHALFPVKLLAILELFEQSKRGSEVIKVATKIPVVQPPEDGFTRAVMSSPPLFDVINDTAVARIRLAYSTSMLLIYQTRLELYSCDGKLLEVVKHPKWSMALSLAIEAELLERILDINPL